MTDKELIQAYRECKSHPRCVGCPHGKDVADCDVIDKLMSNNLIDRLEALLAENERLKTLAPQWVSVKEKLPEVDGQYLVLLESGDVLNIDFESECNNTFGYWSAYYSEDTLGYLGSEWQSIDTVTHWTPRMPLPSTEGVE